MEKVNTLISLLGAIMNLAKDCHYHAIRSYGEHLLADQVVEGLDVLDDLKENVILAKGLFPAPSKVYAMATAEATPMSLGNNAMDFPMLLHLVNKTRAFLDTIETNFRGENALYDEIAMALDKAAALLFLQTTNIPVAEGKGYDKEECKACVEKAIDRAKAVWQDFNDRKAKETILKYEAENTLVAEEETEESALDRVSKKLGIE